MGNPYLEALQDKYSGLRANIEGIQTRAVQEDRDLTDDELDLVRAQGKEAEGLVTQIEELTEIEQRNAKVADLAASLLTGDDKKTQTRGTALGITAQDRDPGHYRSEADGGQHSFFADLYRSRMGDELAAQRLVDHQRALTTGTNGPGVVPPHWLTEEYEELARQGRAVANAVRAIPLGDDPRPLTLPKQVTGTDANVTEQTTEGVGNPEWDDDSYDTDVDTVSPKATSGKQIVSRQMIDMSSPAIDQLIYGDLISVYNTKVEKKVAAAILAAGPAALPAASEESATPVDVTKPTHFANVTVDAAIAVRSARKMPANIALMSIGRYGKFLKLRDTTGRPLMPNPGTGQAVNVVGVGSVAVDGIFEGLGVVATDGVPDNATFAVVRASDVILFESNLLRFRYEEQAGPENIVLGIWGYTAALVRQGGRCVQRVTVS